MMLDVARHFLPMHEVIHMVDLAVHHKLNVLHLHLTDDQGWRFESLRYPKLTEVGAFRPATVHGRNHATYRNQPYGGFYTQSELKRLVAYAAERNVTIVPEIDMPGHMVAAIAAYPELGDGHPHEVMTEWGVSPHVLNLKEETLQFYRDILTEVMDVFLSPFIHVGGDECPRDQWHADSNEQARMTARGVTDVEQYQSWFMHQMDDFLSSHGRRMVGWDEILEGGLAPGAVVMSWRGVQGGVTAAQAGHDVVMSPMSHVYLDYYSSSEPKHPLAIGGYLPLEVVHRWEPVAFGLDSEHEARILGTQGNLWSEYMPTPADVRRMAFPRMSALAEVAWSPRARPSYSDFRDRMKTHVLRLHALGCPEANLPAEDEPIGEFLLSEGELARMRFPISALRGQWLLRVTCASGPGLVKLKAARIWQGDTLVAEDSTAFHLWPVDHETLIKFSGLRMKGSGELDIELTAGAQAQGLVFMSPA
jgi:hexosaminidase